MRSSAPPLITGAVAALLSGRGAALRDLAGDEQNMLHLPIGALLREALQTEGTFWGHLPWSFALRALSLAALGEGSPLSWRLHSVLAHTALSALLSGVGARAGGPAFGLSLGLLAAAHPLLLFYAQDAGNYAWTALLLVVLVLCAPLGGRPTRPVGLAAAVALSLWNDLYALPYVALIGGLSARAAWRCPAARRPLLGAWTVGFGLGALALGPNLARLLNDSADQVALHADPPPPRSLPLGLEVAARGWLRALGSAVGGVTEGRQRQLTAAAPALLLSGGLLALIWRRGGAPARAAAGVVGAVLGLHWSAGVIAEAQLGRVLPFEPRVHIALPALLLVGLAWAGPALRRPLLAAALCAPMLLPTLAEQARLGDLRAWQRAQISALKLADNDLQYIIFDDETARWSGVDAPLARTSCAALPAGARAVWAFDHEPAGRQPEACPGPPPPLRHLRSRPPPAQERNSSSFQPTRSAAVVGAPLPPDSRLLGWTLRVAGPTLGLAAELRLLDAAGAELGRWPTAALPARVTPGDLTARGPLSLVLVETGPHGRELGRSDPLSPGDGGDWTLFLEPLELPIPNAIWRISQALCGLGLLTLSLRRARP